MIRLDYLERIALAAELRYLRFELHQAMLASEHDKDEVRQAIKSRRRRLLDCDIEAGPPSTQGAVVAPAPRLPGMSHGARSGDPGTSHAAADRVSRKITRAQVDVLAVFGSADLSGRQAENLPDLADRYGPSTVRKRVGELHAAGLLEVIGVERGPEGKLTPAMVYRLTVAGRLALDAQHAEAAP